MLVIFIHIFFFLKRNSNCNIYIYILVGIKLIIIKNYNCVHKQMQIKERIKNKK